MTDLVKAMDVSSHQPRDIRPYIRELGVQHVIPKLYLPEEIIPQDYSLDQIEHAFSEGCTVGGYFWGYKDLNPQKSVYDALELTASAGYTPPVLWCDVEPYKTNDNLPGVDWLWAAKEECERSGVRFGIYTGPWVWALLGNPQDFRDVPCWSAEYPGPGPVLEGMQKYGGWTQFAGHQYTSSPVDLSVFLPEYTELAPTRGTSDIAYDMELALGELDRELTWLYHKGRKASEIKASVDIAKTQVGVLIGLKNEVGNL